MTVDLLVVSATNFYRKAVFGRNSIKSYCELRFPESNVFHKSTASVITWELPEKNSH